MKFIPPLFRRICLRSRTVGGLCFVSLSFFLLLFSGGAYLGFLQISGNFHPIVPGEAYRSAQPSTQQIATYHKRYGIRTIINLRGENAGSLWYQAEIAEAKRLGITHLDFSMSASEGLSSEQAPKLVALMQQAEKPLLIHCRGGADRSSMAAALYVAAITKQGERAAEKQFSLHYGHIPLPWFESYAIDQTWEVLEPWLGYPDS